jgi:excisionase family DNA binding protein
MMSVKDLHRESGVSAFTWRSWIRQHRIASVRLGRRVRVLRADFEAFVAANRVAAREQ